VFGIPSLVSSLENEVRFTPMELSVLIIAVGSTMELSLRNVEAAASEYNGNSKKKVQPWPRPSEVKFNTPCESIS